MDSNNKQEFSLASRKRRIASFLIDHIVLTFLIVSAVFLVINPNEFESGSGLLNFKTITIFTIEMFIYFAKDSFKGISFGKWIMGTMVRANENVFNVPSFGRLFLRNLFLILWPVEFIVMAMDENKRRLGDKYSKATVLNNSEKSSRLKRIVALIGVLILLISLMTLLTSSIVKSSDAYKVAIQDIQKNEEIRAEIGEVKSFGPFPKGSVEIQNGEGQAGLQITAIGTKKEKEITIYLIKEKDSIWKIVQMEK